MNGKVRSPERSRRLLAGLVACSVVAGACGVATPSAAPAASVPLHSSQASPAGAPSNPDRTTPVGREWSRHDLGVEAWNGLDLGVGEAGIVASVWSSDRRTLTWSSADGAAWRGPAVSPEPVIIADVEPHESGFLAIGTDGNSAVAWTSDDGLTWRRASELESVAPAGDYDDVGMFEVAMGPTGYLGLGYEQRFVLPDSRHNVVWASPDGVTWERIATIESDLYQLSSDAAGYIAVGQTLADAGTRSGAIWTSPDGITWTDRSDDPDLAGAFVRAAVSGGPGFVAIGDVFDATEQQKGPAVWTSVDGAAWDRLTIPADVADARDLMTDVAVTPTGLLIVGRSGPPQPSDAMSAVSWTSQDGLTWTRSTGVGDVTGSVDEVVTVDGRAVGIGRGPTGPALWISPPTDAAAAPLAMTPPPTPFVPPGADEFFASYCALSVELGGAGGLPRDLSPPEATAWLEALDGDDPKAVLAAVEPVKAHLVAALEIADAGTTWEPGVETLDAVAAVIGTLLANLERIEDAASAGELPEAGVGAYFDDAVFDAITALSRYRNELPEPPPC